MFGDRVEPFVYREFAVENYQKSNKNEKSLIVSSDQRRQRMPMATRDQLSLKRSLWTIATAFLYECTGTMYTTY